MNQDDQPPIAGMSRLQKEFGIEVVTRNVDDRSGWMMFGIHATHLPQVSVSVPRVRFLEKNA